MRRIVSLLLSFVLIYTLTACGQSAASEKREETQPAVQKTEEQFETSQNGAGAEAEKQETEAQPDTEMETEPSESISTGEQEADVSSKTLVVYFSCTGTTKPLAEYAAEITGADLYEIVAEDPYTEADLAYYTNGRADQEQNDPDARPAISGGVENMDEYDTIILGYPIWHGQAPRIISTFLESYDFSGKTIIPFCTSHSSGIGSSADNLHILCSDSAVWLDGRRFEAGTSKEIIEEWIWSVRID
ncbi:MAG: NAD(P)H-dependent oxidoreductase [Lachnospiraceae bacterium]|nr:NAD(P)H-dependent oxidoreductase [Lachnospiraceae bacterium]